MPDDEFRDFFAFRKMVTPSLIRASYVTMTILIFLVGVVLVLGVVSLDEKKFADMLPAGKPICLLVIMLGTIFLAVSWRTLCELRIVIFSIHEMCRGIDKHLEWFRDIGIDVYPKKPKSTKRGELP